MTMKLTRVVQGSKVKGAGFRVLERTWNPELGTQNQNPEPCTFNPAP